MGDTGYPTRGADAFSFPAVVFAAAFFPVFLGSLLGVVFDESAIGRGWGWLALREGTGQRQIVVVV